MNLKTRICNFYWFVKKIVRSNVRLSKNEMRTKYNNIYFAANSRVATRLLALMQEVLNNIQWLLVKIHAQNKANQSVAFNRHWQKLNLIQLPVWSQRVVNAQHNDFTLRRSFLINSWEWWNNFPRSAACAITPLDSKRTRVSISPAAAQVHF